MIHQLKTEHNFFEDVISGKKTFEVRKNDRDFMVGDFLELNELTPHQCNALGEHKETGRCCLVEVTYVLTDKRFVLPGYAVLAIRPCEIGKRTEWANAVRDVWKVPDYNITIPDGQEAQK